MRYAPKKYDRPLKPEVVMAIRKLIRVAIRRQNQQTLFTCCHCAFWSRPKGMPPVCQFDQYKKIINNRSLPTQMPTCFLLEPMNSPMAVVLDKMHKMGVNWLAEDTGWATICTRMSQRSNRFGYIHGVKQRNLYRYES